MPMQKSERLVPGFDCPFQFGFSGAAIKGPERIGNEIRDKHLMAGINAFDMFVFEFKTVFLQPLDNHFREFS